MKKKKTITYGYCRISTQQQSIERQERNIKEYCKEAYIIKEAFTGTKIEGRKQFQKLLATVTTGDTIIFDSVSRMSRNAEEGFELYKKLYNEGINLIFLKEPHINTDVFKESSKNHITITTGTEADILLNAVNEFLLAVAEKQIKIAFEQAEKEVKDLQQRTREGMITAKMNGKQIGQVKGSKLTTKKSIDCKNKIQKINKSFNGSLTDKETIELLGITRNTFYKYKKEMLQEEANNSNNE